MKKLEFNDLVNSVIEEAPITKYLNPALKYGQRLKQNLGRAGTAASGALKKAANVARATGGVVGKVAGAVATGLEAPGKIVKGAHSAVFEPGGLAKGLRAIQKKMPTGKDKDVEKFDKKVVKTLIANQMSDVTAKGKQQQQQTSTTSTQATGQVTGAPGTPGAQSGGTSTASPTSTPDNSPMPSAAEMQREPKSGDFFNLYGKYGRLERFKILKVHDDHVEVKKV